MIKLSFKTTDVHSKIIQRFDNGRVTIVTLRGTVKMECPFPKIFTIISSHPFITAFKDGKYHFTVVGIAKRSPDDTDNPLLTERIAESRAKIKLYKFAAKICVRYIEYLEKEKTGCKIDTESPVPDTWKNGSALGTILNITAS